MYVFVAGRMDGGEGRSGGWYREESGCVLVWRVVQGSGAERVKGRVGVCGER